MVAAGRVDFLPGLVNMSSEIVHCRFREGGGG